MKMIIRADGGNGIGMGHLARTSVLATELSQKLDICYVCNEEYSEGINELRKKGFKVIGCPQNEIIDTMEAMQAVVILTDSYTVDDKYMQAIRKMTPVVVYMDDNGDKAYDAEILLNQNFGAERLDFCCSEGCRVLAGSRYLLVRDEFRKLMPIIIRKDVKDVLVTIGGSDLKDLTGDLLSQVANLPYNFRVVIGADFPHEYRLREEFKNPNIIFYKEPNMSELMKKCDMAISSCGSTLYELGLLGIPTLGLVVADNQSGLAERLGNKQMIHLIGTIGEINLEVFRAAIIGLAENLQEREQLQQRNLGAFNKDGVEWVAQKILEMIENKRG